MGWYGRSFTLADPSCNTPNGVCKFTGGAKPGECSQASGILDLQEIKDTVKSNNLSPQWDKAAAVKWITWDSDQWVSYDDDDTFDQKRKFANNRCLGGTMVWAMDQVDQSADNSLAPAPGVTTQDQEDAEQMRDDLVAGVTCYSTDCGAKCKKGTNEVTQMNGQPGKLSTSGRCNKGEYRSLCCGDGTTMGTCKWRGFRGIGLFCMGGCADGETEVLQDTNNHGKSGDQTCTGGIQSYCCKEFKPAPSPDELKQKAEDEAKAAVEAAAEQAALDIAAKAFCRLAVPALLAPLEALEALIPIVGEVLDVAELAATPALIQLCTKGIEKEGKAVFKVFGKKHSIDNFSKPTAKKTDRPEEFSHSTAKTKDDSCSGNVKRSTRECRVRTVVRTTAVTNVNVGSIVCDANRGYTQPRLNYRSVMSRYPQHRTLTCPYKYVNSKKRTAPGIFYGQRNTDAWDQKMTAFQGCNYDEFPPAAIAGLNDGYSLLNLEGHPPRPVPDRPAYGCYIDLAENQAAGKLFGKCLKNPRTTTDNPHTTLDKDRSPQIKYIDVRAVFMRQQFTLDFPGLGDPEDDGLGENACQDGKCSREIEALKAVATSVQEVEAAVPSAAVAEPTPAVDALGGDSGEEETTPNRNRLGLLDSDLPKQIVAAELV
ncbi:glycosyl hydrolases family 18-domain-containing protein [Hypoxylon cercidicola]|nr:glycosyl hydrolases family 18-domain-containing protein [Hypoxylon cercidicola]